MDIAAHRGHWKISAEKNSLEAFERALRSGMGIETDLRDWQGEVVISHDMPRGGEMTLDTFFELCDSYPQAGPLALNIKADGLQQQLKRALEKHAIRNAFVFDMAVPDALGYLREGIPTYTRRSEYETEAAFLEQAAGIWLDGFHGEWYSTSHIEAWLVQGKAVCIVSPELHGRPHRTLWAALRKAGLHRHPRLSLCTDFPDEAQETFNAKN